MKKILLALLLGSLAARAAERFVAPTGNNSANGSLSSPWKTISYAATNTVTPVVAGDIVRVQAGTYDETVTETTDGTRTAPITYVANGNAVLRRFDITGDYVKVIGFEFTHVN